MKMKCFYVLVLTFALPAMAKDCGIAPSGFSFGTDCALIRSASAAKKSAPVEDSKSSEDKTRWEEVRFTMYSGKPGYAAALGADFKLSLDAVLMNETVTDDIDRAFVRATLGSYRTCQASGLQQAIGYTVFKVRNCR